MRNYVTDSKISAFMKRISNEMDDRLKNNIRNNWEVITSNYPEEYCGNISAYFNKKTGKCKLSGDMSDNLYKDENFVSSYDQISSALALYRTIALFECGLDSSLCDFYKLNWEVIIRHKATGEYLMLGEWKGGFNIRMKCGIVDDLPNGFKKSVESLLNYLTSEKMTINYDGTIAGSVA